MSGKVATAPAGNTRVNSEVKPQQQQQQQRQQSGGQQQQQWRRRVRPPRRQSNNNNNNNNNSENRGGGDESKQQSTVLESKSLRADNKSFYFDKGTNQRGEFVRISEVRPSSRFRSSITVPMEHLRAFCDQLAELLDGGKSSDEGGENHVSEQQSPAKASPSAPSAPPPKSPAKDAAAAGATPTKKATGEGGGAKKMSELFEQQK